MTTRTASSAKKAPPGFRKKLSHFLYRHQGIQGVLYIIPFVVVWALFLAWPVIYGIYISLHEWQGLRGAKFVGFDNYIELFTDPRFWNAFANTLKFSAMVIRVVVCAHAMGLGQDPQGDRDYPGRHVFSIFVDDFHHCPCLALVA
jgi:multiple sugar transport system permease protein